MAKKQLKNCSISLVIKEMQIKMTLGYHLTPDRITNIKNTEDSLCWRGCEGVHSTVDGRTNLYIHFGNWYGCFLGNRESIYLKIELYHFMHLPKNVQSYHNDTYSTMLTAALSVIATT